MSDYVYVSVNEDGLVYNRTTDPDEALRLLNDFPNDFMVTVTTGSPMERFLQKGAYL